MADTTIKGRYTALESTRSPYLERARECAKLSIPSLMPPNGHGSTSKLPTPFQGIGSKGVNNLSSKLLITLFPPNSPIFRHMIDDFALEKLAQKEGARAAVEEALARHERAVQTDIETSGDRVTIHEGMKQLIVSGNVLLYLPPKKKGMRVFRLDRYVVRRDPMGEVLEIIVKENVARVTLPKPIRKHCGVDADTKDANGVEKSLELYTYVRREPDGWSIRQELNGKVVPGSRGSYPLDKCPWIALRWSRIDGEDYGRSFIDEYLGELMSLEALMQAIVEGSAAAAKILFLVKPNGTTDETDVANAPNCAVRTGHKDDVTVVSLEKFNDFRVAKDTMTEITQRLSAAFLMTSSVQRSAERVTAEEIRVMVGELEDTLGGFYSIFAQELQLPYVKLRIHRMELAGKLPKLPQDIVRPMIVTGLEALGRGHDLNKLQSFVEDIVKLAQAKPELVARLDATDLIKRLGTARGIDIKGLIMDEAAFQQQQQQQMQGLLEKLGPNAVNKIGDMATQQMASPSAPEQGQEAA